MKPSKTCSLRGRWLLRRLSSEDKYSFYEAKFTARPVGARVIAEEIAQVKATGLECVTYGFISRSGFEHDALEGIGEDVQLITLEQLYA